MHEWDRLFHQEIPVERAGSIASLSRTWAMPRSLGLPECDLPPAYLNMPDTVRTVAGNGHPGFQDDEAGTTGALFSEPRAISCQADGSAILIDEKNNRIRHVHVHTGEDELSVALPIVRTMAGCGKYGVADGDASSSSFQSPVSIAARTDGSIFVLESQASGVRFVEGYGGNAPFDAAAAAGVTTAKAHGNAPQRVGEGGTLAAARGGGGRSGGGAAADADAPLPRRRASTALAATRKQASTAQSRDQSPLLLQRQVMTVCGMNGPGALADGTGSEAKFNEPSACCLLPNGNLVVADTFNCVIRTVSQNADVRTLAGALDSCVLEDGLLRTSCFMEPTAVAADVEGRIAVIDVDGQEEIGYLRVIDPAANTVYTVETFDRYGAPFDLSGETQIAIDDQGNVICVSPDCGLHVVVNTGLSAGYAPWRPQFWSTHIMRKRTGVTDGARAAIKAIMLVVQRSHQLPSDSGGQLAMNRSLPALPIELWHLILERSQLWEFGGNVSFSSAPLGSDVPGAAGGGGGELRVLRAELAAAKLALKNNDEKNATVNSGLKTALIKEMVRYQELHEDFMKLKSYCYQLGGYDDLPPGVEDLWSETELPLDAVNRLRHRTFGAEDAVEIEAKKREVPFADLNNSDAE